MELSIPDSKIKVTVLDLTPSNHYNLFKNFLLSKLPLRSLPIKIPQRPIHICQNLYLEVLRFEEIIYRKEMGNFIEEPWLNIALVDSESLSQYKGYIKPKLKDWHHTIVDKRDQDWLIVHIDSQNAIRLNPINHQRSQTTNFQGQNASNGAKKAVHQTSLSTGSLQSPKFLQSSILDKLRSDFEDKTRIINLDQLQMDSSEYPQQNSLNSGVIPKLGDSLIGLELVQKIKDRIGPMFTKLYVKYDEEIRKLDNQRLLPGWNFCTFFLIKEGMAQALQLTSFYSDSLRIYDELEALFWETYNSQTLNYFQSFGFLDLEISEFNFLKLNRTEYRTKLSQNNLPLFQLKLYIFQNQFQLLLNSELFPEALDRSLKFLIEMISLIAELSPRDLDSELKTYFWVYSVCFVIVDKVDFMMDKMSLDPVYHRLIIMKKLSLLELGKVQLNQLGIKYSKFPNLPPYNLNDKIVKLSPLSTPPQNFSTIIPLNETLKQIHNIKDSDIVDLNCLFDDFYISLNKRILALHKTLGFDQKGVLDEVLILIELSKKEGIDITQLTKNLEKLEAPLVNSYKLGWTLIEYYLQQTLQIYLNFQQIENFIKLSLKLIPIANTQNSRNFLKFIESHFTESLSKLSRFLIKPIQDNFELLSITPGINEDQGFYLNLRLSNNLLNNLSITNVQLAMLDLKQGSNQVDNSDLIWFKLDNREVEEGGEDELMKEENLYNLRLGINELKLTCNDFNAINYKLEKLLIDLGKLSFILDLSQPDQWLNLSVEYPLVTLEPSYSAKGIRIKLNAPYLNLKQFQLKLKCLGNEVDPDDDDENSEETNEIEEKIKISSIHNNSTELIEILPQRVRDWIWLNFKELKLKQTYSFTVTWKQLGLLKEPINSNEIKTNYLITINDGEEHWIRYKNELTISKSMVNPFEIVDNLQFNNSENNNQSKLISLKLSEKFNNIRILDLKLSLLPTNESDKAKEFNNLSFKKGEVIRSSGVYSQLFELNNNTEITENKENDEDIKESNIDDIIFFDYTLRIQYIDLLKEVEHLLTLKFSKFLQTQNLLTYKPQIINLWLQNFNDSMILDYATSNKFNLEFCLIGINELLDEVGAYRQRFPALNELANIIENSGELSKSEFESEFNDEFYSYWSGFQVFELDK